MVTAWKTLQAAGVHKQVPGNYVRKKVILSVISGLDNCCFLAFIGQNELMTMFIQTSWANSTAFIISMTMVEPSSEFGLTEDTP